MKKVLLLAAAALASAAPSHALTFNITYTGGVTAHVLFSTENTLNGFGGYTITSASGDVGGDAVTLVPGGPNPFGIPGFTTDNIYYNGDPIFDVYGLALQSTSGFYNLWGNGSEQPYTLYKFDTNIGGYTITDGGWLSVASVPEASTWAMLIAGFGLVGFAARRRQAMLAA